MRLTRRCGCGHEGPWFDFANPRTWFVEGDIEGDGDGDHFDMRECPRCQSTLVERTGHVLAATVVRIPSVAIVDVIVDVTEVRCAA